MQSRVQDRQRERGAAVVEFAIVTTILVPIMLYSLFFSDLLRVRLKTAEVARYIAWEMTSYPLSDYESGEHSPFFDRAASNVRQDVLERYADDLRADTKLGAPIKFTTGEFSLTEANIKITNEEAHFLPGRETSSGSTGNAMIDKILAKVNQGIQAVMGFFKFNTKGQIRVEVAIQFKNTLIPRRFSQEFNENELAPSGLGNLVLKEELSLIADSWTLFDGENVYPWGGYSPGGKDALLYQQVDRVTAWGLLSHKIPGFDRIVAFIDKLQKIGLVGDVLDLNPAQTRVASIASNGNDVEKTNKLRINVDCGEGHDSEGMHTTPIRDQTGPANQSEYGKTWEKRGYHYMGCPDSQADNCFR